eukprot:CAMPEP_0119029820 /NCGR_PEP_ID=MMETSP1176-20130426/40714_1 /TAXON_ID=265551 /ORGANISM="Synedropsis recta cf, Strain CCMP1620" /LENGTH=451 /DNA_ID=CAMNT_0006986175 /DNA_START=9 /DNA_END=1360 /DNA_ORIENTATION=-
MHGTTTTSATATATTPSQLRSNHSAASFNAYSTNPYNTRKKVLSKPLIAVAFGIVLCTWIAVTLHVFSSSNASLPPPVSLMKEQETAQQQLILAKESNQHEKLAASLNEKKKKKVEVKPKDNKKKKKKDTTDYRTIKLETPPPKSHHDAIISLDAQIQNLTKHNPVYIGREKLVRMLLEMWIDVTQIGDDIWEQVPLWDDIVKVHGTAPQIHGLTDTNCAAFRDAVPEVDRHVAIAGMFNTGTNLLSILLQHNCAMPAGVEKFGRKKGHGMEWQVPWGKHTPAWYRGGAHVKNFIGRIPEENIMVAVMVRHPHDWMSSMCRHGYTAKWNRTARNCPNLYEGNKVTAKFGAGPSAHDSLAHMWNDWNGVYYNATFPRLMVRFEDTIFFPKETSRQVCTCVGGKLMTPKEKDGLFHYVIDSAKTGPGHGPGQKRNGLIDAWIKYGKARQTKLS